MGPGEGLCLDLGCSTGLYFDVIRDYGRSVAGVDRSFDQMQIAQRRNRAISRQTP